MKLRRALNIVAFVIWKRYVCQSNGEKAYQVGQPLMGMAKKGGILKGGNMHIALHNELDLIYLCKRWQGKPHQKTSLRLFLIMLLEPILSLLSFGGHLSFKDHQFVGFFVFVLELPSEM